METLNGKLEESVGQQNIKQAEWTNKHKQGTNKRNEPAMNILDKQRQVVDKQTKWINKQQQQMGKKWRLKEEQTNKGKTNKQTNPRNGQARQMLKQALTIDNQGE